MAMELELTPEFMAQLEQDVEYITRCYSAIEPMQRIIDAVPALVAAVKERDSLAWKLDNTTKLYASHRNDASTVAAALGLDGWEHGWSDVAPHVERLRVKRDQLSEVLGKSQTDCASLVCQVDQLRAEVERLRALGRQAVGMLEGADDVMYDSDVQHLRAEIDKTS